MWEGSSGTWKGGVISDQETALSIATAAQTHPATGIIRARCVIPRPRHGDAKLKLRRAEPCRGCLYIDCRLREKNRLPIKGPSLSGTRGMCPRLALLISLFAEQEPSAEGHSGYHQRGQRKHYPCPTWFVSKTQSSGDVLC